jgi:hypothetical protein
MSSPGEFRFSLRALFTAITLAGLFLALDRATAGTSLNVSLRAIGLVVAWTWIVVAVESATWRHVSGQNDRRSL